MSDPKVPAGPRPPVEWDLPDPVESDGPDRSFNDDHVGARLKLDEANRQRLSQDRFAVEQPRTIQTQSEKVQETSAYRGAQPQDDEARRQARDNPARPQTRGVRRRPLADRMPDGVQSLERVEQQVQAILADLQALEEGSLPPHELAAQLAYMEGAARKMLQTLLAGGVGFQFLGDPRLAFKRLFDRIRRWPRQVRPGRRPESDADFDDFLAWVFEPPRSPEDLESFQ